MISKSQLQSVAILQGSTHPRAKNRAEAARHAAKAPPSKGGERPGTVPSQLDRPGSPAYRPYTADTQRRRRAAYRGEKPGSPGGAPASSPDGGEWGAPQSPESAIAAGPGWNAQHHVSFPSPDYPRALRNYFHRPRHHPHEPPGRQSHASQHQSHWEMTSTVGLRASRMHPLNDEWAGANPIKTHGSLQLSDPVTPDATIAPRHFRKYGAMRSRGAPPAEAPTPWDDRFHVKVSKDNVTLHPTHREYFSTGSSLDRLTSSQWRQLQR